MNNWHTVGTQVAFNFVANQFYRFRVEAIGETITCELVGEGFQQLTMAAPDNLTGTVGFRNAHIVVDHDNLLVTSAPSMFSCSGFYPPMDKGTVTVKKGKRVFPLRAQLLNLDGATVTDLDISSPPVVQITYQAAGGGQVIDITDEALPAGFGSEGNEFEYDIAEQLWRFNLRSGDYTAAGTYTIEMVSGDDSEYVVGPTCTASFARIE